MGKLIYMYDKLTKVKADSYDRRFAATCKRIKFAVKEYVFLDSLTGAPCNIPMIVIVDTYTHVTLRLTGLEKYASLQAPGQIRIVGRRFGNRSKLSYIVKMLNFVLLENYDLYHIKNVSFLTFQAVQDFIHAYASTPYSKSKTGYAIEKRPKPETVKKMLRTVTIFCENLRRHVYMPNFKDELYSEKTFKGQDGMLRTQRIPLFQATAYDPYATVRTQDIETQVVFRMLALARIYDPGLMLAIASQAFAGLREGEVVNMYRQHTVTGAKGVRIEKQFDCIRNITIDLLNPAKLSDSGKRSDISKKRRQQQVYPDFLDLYNRIYNEHLALIAEIENEAEDGYYPMFYNRQKRNGVYGNMSADSYRARWQKIFNLALEECAVSPISKLRLFAQIATEQRFTPHCLRHWFSVYVALHVDNALILQFWRGDKSLDSAATYLRDKAILKGLARMGINDTAKYMRTRKAEIKNETDGCT